MIKKIIKKILPNSFIKIIKRLKSSLPVDMISEYYKIIKNPNLKELKKNYDNIWQDASIPKKQLELTKKELPDFMNVPPMRVVINLLKKTKLSETKLLEIGCSTGYYSEVFKRAGFNFQYEGCDYSDSFIKLAKKQFPKIKFAIEDATKLNYQNNEFDIVISGCCILHIIDYQKAINEATRVAKKFVIFHRTPILHISKTIFTKKMGYGLNMLEILFNEEELINLFYKNRLVVQNIITYAQSTVKGIDELIFIKSYLCKKI